MKRLCRVLAVFFLAAGLILPVSEAYAVGRDEKIATLQKAGLVTGYPDGTLGLDKPIKRSEMSVLLMRMMGRTVEGAGLETFEDVPSDHWASGYIYEAHLLNSTSGVKIISGYPDNTFKPEKNITNAEIMKILVVMSKSGLTPQAVGAATWPSSWVAWSDEMGIIGAGSGLGHLNPNAPAKRGDVFTMIYNAAASMVGPGEPVNFQPVPKSVTTPGAALRKPLPKNYIAAFNSGSYFDHRAFQQEFLRIMNMDRSANGLPPLQWAEDLTPGTVQRSQELADYGSVMVNGRGHVRLDGRLWDTAFDYLQPQFQTVARGENLLGIPFYQRKNTMVVECKLLLSDPYFMARYCYAQWWSSPGHRANMMDPNYRYANVQVRVSPKSRDINFPGGDIVNFTATTVFRGEY